MIKVPSRTKKFRGSRYHGRGKKAGRGKGKRGGKGNAGLDKHKWIWTVKNDPNHYGVHGFTSHHKKEEIFFINVGTLENQIEKFKKEGIAKPDDGSIRIDLAKIGVNKLLGCGNISTKMKVVVPYCSAKAKEKIEQLGGEIINA